MNELILKNGKNSIKWKNFNNIKKTNNNELINWKKMKKNEKIKIKWKKWTNFNKIK